MQIHSTCELSEKPGTGRKNDNFVVRRSYSPMDSGGQMSAKTSILSSVTKWKQSRENTFNQMCYEMLTFKRLNVYVNYVKKLFAS